MTPGLIDPAVSSDALRSLGTLSESYEDTIVFYLNGTRVELDDFDPEVTLLEYLRGIGLTGTKLGCAEGGCGACTVVISQYNPTTKQIYHASVNACLAPLISVDGKHVITVEGIGNTASPHPVQERIAKSSGSQCGFCTPGIVMSLYALLRNNSEPSEQDVEEAFDGNLCRCTGYRPILDAAQTFSKKSACGLSTANGGTGCCMEGSAGSKKNECARGGESGNGDADHVKFTPPNFVEYQPDTELIFPPALRKHSFQGLALGNKRKRWFRPVTVDQLLEIKAAYPSAKVIGGSTETQIEIKFKAKQYTVSVYAGDIPELREYSFEKDHLDLGANVCLTDLEDICQKAVQQYGDRRAQPFSAIHRQIKYFAGRQIRNVGTPAGNLATASPISDLNPVFVASGATLVARCLGKTTEIPMRDFFTGYRTTALAPDAIISRIKIPLSKEKFEYLRAYKQAKRKDDDIAIVNAALRVSLDEELNVIDSTLCYGGMAPTTVTAERATNALRGRKWSDPDTLEAALNALEEDFDLRFGVPGGMATYRRSLALGFFHRFYHDVLADLTGTDSADDACEEVHRGISYGKKDHETAKDYEKRVVGKSNPHVAALKHTTGEAQYTDDIPVQKNELFGSLVLSSHAHAKILSVDESAAFTLPGVARYIDHRDLPSPKANWWGAPTCDETFFAVDEVFTHGQIIGMVLADSAKHAEAGARAIKVEYEDLPAIYTIEEAIQANSYHPHFHSIVNGDTEKVFEAADHVFSGIARMGGQEHFYLETQACLAIPKSGDGEMEVWSSTQNLSETQAYVAQVTGLQENKIVAKVKRLGGGFGGKETRSLNLAAIVSLAAHKVKRPVRCMLNRDEDIVTSGQRHPFLAHWKVAVNKDGKLQALDCDVFNNAGWSQDLSAAVVDRALAHIDNCYHIPNVNVRGRPCKTNTVSNTAFRGFGGPQGMFIAETYMEHIADQLDIPIEKLREINMYQPDQQTHFNQALKDWHVPLMWKQSIEEAQYYERHEAVAKFNAEHRWKKRGISIIPTKFGISFTALWMNQAGALVHIYHDGSVLVAHGGTEMGQGLHTKMTMIAAEALGVPMEDVYISESATNTVANASATAASVSSDLNGYAIENACQQINQRLAPYREKLGKDATMKQLAHAAYFDRVDLSAHGFYKTPDIGYVWGENRGKMYFYFTSGVAVAEVEVDTLTGDWTCLRTDIKMDVGRSINPAIDYGQIEGAYVQGQGLFTTEESLWLRDSGQLFTRGPGAYKIPGFRDIPQEFNVSLLKGVQWENLRTIQRSRGVGEPPLFMGSAVFWAIRQALKAQRLQHDERQVLDLQSPATPERIRVSCADSILKRSMVTPRDGEKSFFVAI